MSRRLDNNGVNHDGYVSVGKANRGEINHDDYVRQAAKQGITLVKNRNGRIQPYFVGHPSTCTVDDLFD